MIDTLSDKTIELYNGDKSFDAFLDYIAMLIIENSVECNNQKNKPAA